MANTLLLKRSSTASNVPTAGELSQGELAINTADERLFSKNSSNVVFEITDHDNLTNYVANEHIDWTSATQNFSTSGTITGVNVTSGADPGHTHGAGSVPNHDSLNGFVANEHIDWTSASSAFHTTSTVKQGTDGASTVHLQMDANSGGFVIEPGTSIGGWARGHSVKKQSDGTVMAGAGFLGSNEAVTSWHVGFGASWWATDDVFRITPTLVESIVNHDFLAGIDVTGNITVTGTVDGIDIAALDAAVAKTADTETITGTWTLDGTVTTSDYGTGGRVKDGTDVSRPIGFNVMPVYEIDANDTFDLAHNGMIWHKDAGVAVTFSCPNDTTIPQGATYAVFNDDTENVTISPNTGVTLFWLEAGAAPSSGSFTISQGGIVTVYKYSDTEWWAWGSKDAASAGATTLAGLTDTDITTPADASFLIYDTGTGDWRDFTLSGDVSCTDAGVVTVNNDSHTHDIDNLTGLTAISSAWTHTGNNVGFRYGINGDYSSTGASTLWGATIWAIDSSWQGGTAADNSSSASVYGIRWLRASHSSANGNIGEGLYVYTGGSLEGGIGTTGIYTPGALEVTGNADIGAGLDVTGNITVTGTVDGVDVAGLIPTGMYSSTYKRNIIQYNRWGANQDMGGTSNWNEGIYGGYNTMTNGPTGMTYDPFLVMGSAGDVRSFLVVPRTDSRPIAYKGSYGSGATHTAWHYTGWTTTAANADLSKYLRSDAADQKTSGNLRFNDNVQLNMGTGDDADIYFNGTDLYIDLIDSADFRLRGGAANDSMIVALDDAGVELYYNGSLTLNTTANGVDVRSTSATQTYFNIEDSSGNIIQWLGWNAASGLHLKNTLHGSNFSITAEDAGGTERTILTADPDSTTELRADTNLSLTTTAGADTALLATANADVALYYNNTEEFRTASATGTSVSSGAEVRHHSGTFYDVGFNLLPSFQFNVSDTLEARHCGVITGKTNTTAYTLTGPDSTATANADDFPVGGVCTVANLGTSVNYTINDTTTCTMYYLDGSAAPQDIVGTGTLAPGGIITLWRYSTTAIYIWGSGFTP